MVTFLLQQSHQRKHPKFQVVPNRRKRIRFIEVTQLKNRESTYDLFFHITDSSYQAINCQWSAWDIGTCSRTCGSGERKKTRTKEVMEMFGGICNGESSEFEPCNTNNCPGLLVVFTFLLAFKKYL